jgi:protein TonB
MPHRQARAPGTRLIGIGLVILLHIAIVYALVTGLAHRAIEVVRAPIMTEIIEAPRPERREPPPPPPQFTPPAPVFVPPPEIHIERPPPPPPKSSAVTAVTPVKPVAPPPPVAAPVRVEPRLDAEHSREPDYPSLSRRLGEQGSAVIQILVDVDGRVIDAKLLQSSGHDRLDQAALAGVRHSYRFLPGTVDGKPVQMWYTFKFIWKLR